MLYVTERLEVFRSLARWLVQRAAYRLRHALVFALGLVCFATGPVALAAGTAAGTLISNIATLSYTLSGVAQSDMVSAPTSVRVDEVIHPVLTWQDGTPVSVNTPGVNDVLTFRLTNSGNGAESFSLARTNGPAPVPAGNYVPLNGSIGSIYLESGASPGFQASGPNADALYTQGSNDPLLNADASVLVYVVSDTPLVAANSRGDVRLDVASTTAGLAGTVPGTGFSGLGQAGTVAVSGSSRGQANSTGSYLASGMSLTLAKSVSAVQDPVGGSVLMPGSTVTYQLLATLNGSGAANALVITDPLPVAVTYVAGSIAVDGVVKTDAADTDNAEFSAASRTVSVTLGNVAAPATIVVTFRATIN
jgi:fimbrial isopeptide formation D2 family protein